MSSSSGSNNKPSKKVAWKQATSKTMFLRNVDVLHASEKIEVFIFLNSLNVPPPPLKKSRLWPQIAFVFAAFSSLYRGWNKSMACNRDFSLVFVLASVFYFEPSGIFILLRGAKPWPGSRVVESVAALLTKVLYCIFQTSEKWIRVTVEVISVCPHSPCSSFLLLWVLSVGYHSYSSKSLYIFIYFLHLCKYILFPSFIQIWLSVKELGTRILLSTHQFFLSDPKD
jgi:hypothetical protein